MIKGYVDKGWKLVPIPKGEKAPSGRSAKGWQTKYITDPKAIGDGNVGILLGEPSGWLIDIDLDWPEAASMAANFLPATSATFGRVGNPGSHWLYICSGARTKKFQIAKKEDGGMIVELRSTGAQTVFPPSVHPSGESIEWEADGAPSEITHNELAIACGKLAAAALLVRNWASGIRQDISFAIAGMLLKLETDIGEVEDFIHTVASTAGDDEVKKRVSSVNRTAKKLHEGEVVAGYSALEELLGKDVAKKISTFLGATESVPDGSIYITNIASKDLAKQAWANIVSEEPPTLFSFGEEVARIDGGIQVLQEKGFWQEVAARTDWVKAAGKSIVPCDPPSNSITFMRNQRKSEIPLPRLEGWTNTPVLDGEGSIHVEPGYDSNSKFYLHPTIQVNKISVKPKVSEIKTATELLEELLHDFPFVHASDRAHAYAMIILPFVRPIIQGSTPLHLLDKPMQGTGATLLAEAATMIKTGTALAAQGAPRTEEEWQKVILSKLMQAPEFLFLDNVRVIYSDSLAIALTAQVFEGRKLGFSEMVRVPIRCTWIMTGNNVEMGGDFPRRIIQIRLDANTEDPTTRSGFLHPDLHQWILNERGNLVWAILTIARAWIAEGKPPGDAELASYNDWSKVIGGILKVIGINGMLQTPDERKKIINPFIEIERDFIRCWMYHALKDENRMTMRSGELLNLCEVCELNFGYSSNGRDMNSMTFSKGRLAKLADRVFNIEGMSIKVERAQSRGNGAWKLELLSGDTDVDPDEIWQGAIWQ